MHRCRFGQVKPATHTKFWQDKRRGNVERDKRNLRKLRKAGWKVFIIWECQTRKLQKLTKKLKRFLSS
jgi:DNA mismatch endonuclease (patch repair protein)